MEVTKQETKVEGISETHSYYRPSKIFHGIVWPTASALFAPLAFSRAFDYLRVKHDGHFSEKDFTLEVGAGAMPFYKIYNKGEVVLVDWQRNLLKTNKILSKVFHLKGENKVNYVVADNDHLPFRPQAFSKIVSANGMENTKEELRVLKRDGKAINAWFTKRAKVLAK